MSVGQQTQASEITVSKAWWAFQKRWLVFLSNKDLASLRMSVVNLNHSGLGLVKAPGVSSLLSGAALAAAPSFLPT